MTQTEITTLIKTFDSFNQDKKEIFFQFVDFLQSDKQEEVFTTRERKFVSEALNDKMDVLEERINNIFAKYA